MNERSVLSDEARARIASLAPRFDGWTWNDLEIIHAEGVTRGQARSIWADSESCHYFDVPSPRVIWLRWDPLGAFLKFTDYTGDDVLIDRLNTGETLFSVLSTHDYETFPSPFPWVDARKGEPGAVKFWIAPY